MNIVYTRAILATPEAAGRGTNLCCEACRDEIHTAPVMRADKVYCCDGCADGGPCSC